MTLALNADVMAALFGLCAGRTAYVLWDWWRSKRKGKQ